MISGGLAWWFLGAGHFHQGGQLEQKVQLERATSLFLIVAPGGGSKAQRFDSEEASFVMDPGEQLVDLVISPLDGKT